MDRVKQMMTSVKRWLDGDDGARPSAPEPNPDIDEWLTRAEASYYSKMTFEVLGELIELGELKAYTQDGTQVFLKADLDALMHEVHILQIYYYIPDSQKREEEAWVDAQFEGL